MDFRYCSVRIYMSCLDCQRLIYMKLDKFRVNLAEFVNVRFDGKMGFGLMQIYVSAGDFYHDSLPRAIVLPQTQYC
jgi:hypothetical protein